MAKKDIWQGIFKGIEDQRRAFPGPHTAQIDLTDRCNSTCIGCWVHSPLLDKKDIFPQGQKELPFYLVKRLINQLHRLGAREIVLSGSGEPFLYPRIAEIIRLIKSKGIYLNIITNSELIDRRLAEDLVYLGVDLITASVWAGSEGAYLDTHPGKSSRDFEKIRANLKNIAAYKQSHNSLLPHVRIYNVVCAENYSDLKAMVDFGKEVDADSVEFQIIDVITGKTENLLLSSLNLKEIINQLEEIRRRKDMVSFGMPLEKPLAELQTDEFSDLGKAWKDYKPGLKINDYCLSLTCKRNLCIEKERMVISESTSQRDTRPRTFWYKFRDQRCLGCGEKSACLDKNTISIKLMNILGIGSFIRRCFSSGLEKGLYEGRADARPCYIGWYYTRVLTTGDVIGCCKAARHPLGNIYRSSFSKIWSSPAYQEFRFKAKNLSKSDPYFSRINCIKSCDNWGMNLEIKERFKEFKEDQATLAKAGLKGKIILAKNFINGNFNPGNHDFGQNLIIDGGSRRGFGRYAFEIERDADFEFWSRYAGDQLRPVDIYIDGNLAKREGLNSFTGGWTEKFLKWQKEFDINLQKGKHGLEIRSQGPIPHIEKFALVKKGELPKFISREKNGSYLKQLTQRISKDGLKRTLPKVLRSLEPGNLKSRYLEMLGIYDGKYGYKGPFHVQIDLTNNCNNNCIACWCNSPLFKTPWLKGEEKKQCLPLAMVKELLDETSARGATEIYYSGSGEPFMHRKIMEILEYTKRKGLICHVNTNFTLLDKERLDRLANLGVDFLTVSTWSATAATYAKTHPNKKESDFYKIKENLIYLNSHKKDKPKIKLYNVLFNMNYFEAEKMLDFAKETGSESLEFTLVDTMPGATDVLSLNQAQLLELRALCARIRANLDKDHRLKNTGLLIFQFDQFLRRIAVSKDAKEAKYDRNIIDSMPCYIGWLFSRIIPNGQVHSCLKAHRIPTGSLYENRFSEIWNSKEQINFRQKSLVYKKDDPFFKGIGNDPGTEEAGCYKSCDDIGRNTWMHNRIQCLSPPERLALKAIAKSLATGRKLAHKKEEYRGYHSNPLTAGIIHGRRAFLGPEQVVIDPTNKCNLKCISCWLHSPLLVKDKPSADCLKKELPKDTLIKLIDDLPSLGTRRVRFTGGGEPFMHKDLMEIIEHARSRNLLVALTTNFGLAHRKDIKRLIDLGLEELCISIWASNPETYRLVHPDTAPSYFEKLKENLSYLKQIRKENPRLTFANVLMNNNFRDFNRMYELGLEYNADALYFTLADVFTDQTDRFLLGEEEGRELLDEALKIKARSKKDNMNLEFFDGFLRRLSSPQEDFEKGEYDKVDIDKIPCYAGWIFSRILADGNVVPCCRGVKKILGNINKVSFRDIWNSPQYNQFRAKAKYLAKTDPYFKETGCIKECDNLMHNEQMHSRLRESRS